MNRFSPPYLFLTYLFFPIDLAVSLAQASDPYVAQAKKEGYRARSAFKLIEMDKKLRLFRPHAKSVFLDLGYTQWDIEIDMMPKS